MRLKFLTFGAIIATTLLQLFWLTNTYGHLEKDIKEKSEKHLSKAINSELYARIELMLKELPQDEPIIFGFLEDGEKTDEMINLQETFSDYGSEVSLIDLDSIYTYLLNENKIYSKHIIYLFKNDTIIDVTEGKLSKFGKIALEPIYIRTDKSIKIQAILINPHWDIFAQMGSIILATFIISGFIGGSIIYQIRIIINQNKLAQIREDFANAIIHEMKTPLTSIIMGVNILLTGKLDGMHDKIKDYLRVIGKEGEKLLSLTDRVLNMAKLESKGVILNKVNVRINSIINDLIEKFSIRDSKEIKFTTDIRVNTVYADQEYLTDAISNLMENAIKYSGDSVEIKITVENIESFTHIKIRDDGFGIAHNDLVKIFEKYERASATKRSAKGGATGFGIGLSYVQEIAKAHKGTVEIESIKGKYSEFTLKIPTLIEEL